MTHPLPCPPPAPAKAAISSVSVLVSMSQTIRFRSSFHNELPEFAISFGQISQVLPFQGAIQVGGNARDDFNRQGAKNAEKRLLELEYANKWVAHTTALRLFFQSTT
ncbi:MAG: hypothetical protein ACOYOU_10565 [Kiritimatiellia bacterium]